MVKLLDEMSFRVKCISTPVPRLDFCLRFRVEIDYDWGGKARAGDVRTPDPALVPCTNSESTSDLS